MTFDCAYFLMALFPGERGVPLPSTGVSRLPVATDACCDARLNTPVLNGNVFQPPKTESLNGLLLGYRIYYRELDYDAGAGTESKTIQNPSALRAELTRKPVFWTL